MKLKLAALAFLAACGMVHAEPVKVTAAALSSFQNLSSNTEFGALAWRGGLALESTDGDFGGLSGLALKDDCKSLVAVSDAGRWFTARLGYDQPGHLASIGEASMAPILDSKGRKRGKLWADAEALAEVADGQYLAGFESRARLGLFDLGKSGLAARFQLVKSPKAITEGPFNGELEAVGRLAAGPYKGHYIALSEKNYDTHGNLQGWVWKGWKTLPFTIARLEDFDITDLALLPGGGVLILERSYSRTSLPGMAIRRFRSSDIAAGAVIKPEIVFEGRLPFYAIDNMEGMALCVRDGETRLTLVSDNNFNTGLQRTLLLQFAYRP